LIQILKFYILIFIINKLILLLLNYKNLININKILFKIAY